MPRKISQAKARRRLGYHHGNLPKALLAAAERILVEDGPAALTLRAVSRQAGVSHTAARHHFEDLNALLTEVAAGGFERMREYMSADIENDPRPVALGLSYVQFATKNPALFKLMFQDHRVDTRRQSFLQAADKTIDLLAKLLNVAGGVRPKSLTLSASAEIGAVWGLVHGIAMLEIDGRLTKIIQSTNPQVDVPRYIEAALSSNRLAGALRNNAS
jgi:AcrR family transcriptional regulator